MFSLRSFKSVFADSNSFSRWLKFCVIIRDIIILGFQWPNIYFYFQLNLGREDLLLSCFVVSGELSSGEFNLKFKRETRDQDPTRFHKTMRNYVANTSISLSCL